MPAREDVGPGSQLCCIVVKVSAVEVLCKLRCEMIHFASSDWACSGSGCVIMDMSRFQLFDALVILAKLYVLLWLSSLWYLVARCLEFVVLMVWRIICSSILFCWTHNHPWLDLYISFLTCTASSNRRRGTSSTMAELTDASIPTMIELMINFKSFTYPFFTTPYHIQLLVKHSPSHLPSSHTSIIIDPSKPSCQS